MQELPSTLQQLVTRSYSVFACITDCIKRFQLVHLQAAVQQNNNIDSYRTNDSIKFAIGEVQILFIQYCLEYVCGIIKIFWEEFVPLSTTLYHYCLCSRARVWWGGIDCQWPARSVLGLGSGEGRLSGCSTSRPPTTAIEGVPMQHMPPTSLPCLPPDHMQTKLCTLKFM